MHGKDLRVIPEDRPWTTTHRPRGAEATGRTDGVPGAARDSPEVARGCTAQGEETAESVPKPSVVEAGHPLKTQVLSIMFRIL